MINVGNGIKNAYDISTTQIDKIIVDGEDYRITKVQYDDDCYEEGNIFGTAIARCLEFEVENTVDLENKEFEYITGIKINNEINWISLGNFITTDIEANDTTNVSKITAMDYMLKSNIIYTTDLNYDSGDISLLQVVKEACNKADIVLATEDFANNGFIVDSNQFGTEALIRQVFQAAAQISGTVAKIKSDNKLHFINPNSITNVSKVFTLNNYKEAEIKRLTHPINIVSLGMTDIEGENVTLRDENSILHNGENTLTINDNPFAYTQAKREQLITALFNAVKGFEYKSYAFKCQSLFYLETMDKIQFKDRKGGIYSSYIFRFNYKSPNGLDSSIEAPSIIRSTVRYQNLPSALDIAKHTEALVDKQEGKINLLVEETKTNIDNINNSIKLTDRFEKQNNVTINSAEANLFDVNLFGESSQEKREGYNLVKYSDTFKTGVVAPGVTDSITTEGYLKVTRASDSTGYYFTAWWNSKNNFDEVENSFKEGDTFTIVFTVKKITDINANPLIYIKSDMGYFSLIGNVTEEFSEIYYTGIWKKQNNINIHLGIPVGTIVIKNWMIKKGEYEPYEPYGAMPSPEFPSSIINIGSNINELNINDNWQNSGSTVYKADLVEDEVYTIKINNPNNSKTYKIKGSTHRYGYNNFDLILNANNNFTSSFTYKIHESNKNAENGIIIWDNGTSTELSFAEVGALKIKIEKGSNSTGYTKYNCGGMDIDIVGENVFNNKGRISNVTRNEENDFFEFKVAGTYDNLALRNTVLKSIKPDTDYKIVFDIVKNTLTENLTVMTVNTVFEGSEIKAIQSGDTGKKIFQMHTKADLKNALYDFWISHTTTISGDFICKIMVTESDDCEYKPYRETTTTIELPEGVELCSLSNGARDYIDNTGLIHKKIKKIEIDSSVGIQWSEPVVREKTCRFYIRSFVDMLKISDNVNTYCTHLKAINIYNTDEIGFYVNYFNNNYASIYFSLPKEIGTTLEEIKAWFDEQKNNGTPVTVYYELESEDVSQSLSDADKEKLKLIKTFKGITRITSSAKMSASYYRDNDFNAEYETKTNSTKNYTEIRTDISGIKNTVSETNTYINNNIVTRLVETEQNLDGMKISINQTGGQNLIKNSTLRFGIDKNVTTTGTVTVEQYSEILNNTTSKSAIKINNGSVIFNPVNTREGCSYTFSCLVNRLELANPSITITNVLDEKIEMKIRPNEFVEIKKTFTALSGQVQIKLESDNNYCLFSDCMLNAGSEKINWQLASGEIANKSVTISDEGAKFSNSLIKTEFIIDAAGNKIVNTETGETRAQFNADDTFVNNFRVSGTSRHGNLINTDFGDHIVGSWANSQGV